MIANMLPDVSIENVNGNPTISSPSSPFSIQFYQTRDGLDTETYRSFLKNIERRFRTSRNYSHYKSYLIGLGLDRCQVHSNIRNTEDQKMATIEMHHNMLTLFDLALIISEHLLNTVGYVSSFDVVYLLKQEHINNRVMLVMLSLTPHQLYHNNPDFFIHPSMCFGNWIEFLQRYNKGITIEIARKIIYYLEQAIQEGGTNDNNLLTLRDAVKDWSYLNQLYFS